MVFKKSESICVGVVQRRWVINIYRGISIMAAQFIKLPCDLFVLEGIFSTSPPFFVPAR